MSKIICDICGTTYQDTAECCPICGCSRTEAAALFGDDLLLEEIVEEPRTKGGRFSSKKKKEIFDYDEVNSDPDAVLDEQNPYDDDEEEYEEAPRHNTFAVICLTILISLLLIAAAFLFVRFYLPNSRMDESTPPTIAQLPRPTDSSTVPAVPCTGLALTSGTASGKAELTKQGQFFLLHVTPTPENTTDKVIYTSADESIATVTEDGRITAVSEGETKIYITCGSIQLDCPVVCSFVEDTTPPTEDQTDATTDEDVAGETSAEVAGETSAVKTGIVLKLQKTDIKLGVGYYVTLRLDCDLEQNEVQWVSEHPYIASVDENGVVRALKTGTTSITAKYGDQEVKCMVRCG